MMSSNTTGMPAEDATDAGTERGQLKRSLGFFDLVAYGLAYMALIAPLTNLGFVWTASGGVVAGAYVVAAVCMYFTAQSYATMSRIVPNAGSVYGFARHSLGDFWGFFAGWGVLLDYLMVPALVFALMAVGMQMLVPDIPRTGWIVGVALLMLAINWAGIKVAARVNAASVIAQLVMVVGVMVLLVMAMNQGTASGARLSIQPFLGDGPTLPWGQWLAGASVAVMTFLGFDAVSTLSEEVKNPNDRSTVSRAILAVLAIAASLYVLLAWILGSAMAAIRLQDPAAAIFELLGQVVGPWAPALLAWLLGLIVGFTNTLPMLVGVARILMAMGRDRQLPTPLGWVHAGTGVPRVATFVSTAISMVVALWLQDQIDLLASIISFGALLGFLMLHLAVLVHFHREPAGRHAFFHRVVPVVGILSVLAILSGMHAAALEVGLAWILVGGVYGLYLRRRGRTTMHV